MLAPDSYWALAGSQTALFAADIVNPGLSARRDRRIGGVDTYMTQNVPTYTGTAANDDARHRHRRAVDHLCVGARRTPRQ